MTGAARQLDALTGLRGLAAWLVVLYHLRLSLTGILPPSAISFLAHGYLAVDLFFVMSGFVMWYNYAAPLASGQHSFGSFIWRRFARIWPLHVLVLAAFILFAIAARLAGRPNTGMPFAELPLHFLLIQNWGFLQQLSWNDPAWSISTEFAAYLFFPLAVTILTSLRLKRPMLVVLALTLAALEWGIFAWNGLDSLGDAIPHLGLWRCLCEFTLGLLVCLEWQAETGSQTKAAPYAASLAGLIAISMITRLPGTAFIPLAFALALALLLRDRKVLTPILNSRPLVWLGKISYSTYLVHVFVFIVFKLLFVDASLQIGWGGLAAYLVIVLAVSALLFRLVEQPAQRWLNAHSPAKTLPARSVLGR